MWNQNFFQKHFNIIIPYPHISFHFFFPSGVASEISALLPSASCVAQNAPVASWMRSTTLVFLLLRCDASILGNWLPTFRNKLAHTSSWSEIFFNICTIEHENTSLSRIFECRLPRDTVSYSTVTDVQKERVLLRETKKCKMQDITVF